MQNFLTRALDQCLERIDALTAGDPDFETLRVQCYATEVLKEARRESAADCVMLSADLAEDIENSLDACVDRLQFLGDSSESSPVCIEAGEAALKRYRKAREQPQAGAIMGAAQEWFDGPLRLATICMQQAADVDLYMLTSAHTLDFATAVDDWKTRAEIHILEFQQYGPKKSGTG